MKKNKHRLFFIQFLQLSFTVLLLLLFALTADAQRIVTGKVTDKEGKPVAAATVAVKNKQVFTTTDDDGKFSIAASAGDALVITSVGYDARELVLTDNTTVSVELAFRVTTLDDVVMVGYGTVKKKDLTGSVAVVNVDNAKKTASYDVAKLLQGQAAGISVHGSGEPGGFVQIKIRGISTFGNNSPLFVIDGVPVTAPFDFSPDDIESIQILKDASAAAIYGSRAATGVVIITTRKGKPGQLRINYSGYYGWQNITKRIPLTDRIGYQNITSRAEVNAGLSIAPGNNPTGPDYIDDVDTDWQEEMFQTGRMQDHSISLSGGNEGLSHNTSLGYFEQSSTLVGPQRYKRYTFNTNFMGRKGKFSYGGRIAYTQSNKNNLAITTSHAVFGGGVTSMLTAIPTMPVYDPNRLGGFGGSDNVKQRAITLNVIGMNSLVTDYSNRNRMFANIWGELEIIKNLRYKLNISYDRTDYKNFHYEPKFDLGFYYLNTQYYLTEQRGKVNTGLVENTLTYGFDIGKHRIDLLAGATYQNDQGESTLGTATDTATLQFITFGAISNPDAKGITSVLEKATLISYLGRFNYNYDNRYLLTGNFRRDGSSRFSPLNRYGNFASIAGAWNISNEKFIRLPNYISSLKLRSGYGELGNQQFGNYQFQSYINANASYLFGNVLAPGSTIVTIADPSLKWETSITSNVAVDMGLFNERLSLTIEYFNKRSLDLITSVPLPYSVGTFPASLVTNAASVKNTGVELTVSYKKREGAFKYDISANANTLKNRVLKLGGTNNNPINGSGSKTEVGRSVGDLFGFITEGIFSSPADVASHATQTNAAPGDVKFKDVDGRDAQGKLTGAPDGAITDDDRVYLGSVIPNFYFGLNVNASYKNFDLSFFFQGSTGNKVFNGVYQALVGGQYSNHHRDALNYWTPTNLNTNIPRPVIGDPNGNGRFSDRFVENGSYGRLQNAQLGYTVPASVLGKTKAFKSCRLYISGQNIFTIANYRGYDPDFISDGLFSRGFDYGSFPNPRTIMVGLQLGL
jgi:TonB-dependent starch-binding outer membrane protein SusC